MKNISQEKLKGCQSVHGEPSRSFRRRRPVLIPWVAPSWGLSGAVQAGGLQRAGARRVEHREAWMRLRHVPTYPLPQLCPPSAAPVQPVMTLQPIVRKLARGGSVSKAFSITRARVC